MRDEPLEGELWDDVDFAAESSEAWSEEEGAVEAGRVWEEEGGERKRRRRRGSAEEGGRGGSVVGLVVEGDGGGLEGVRRAQFWVERVRPEEREVDVSLGGGECEFTFSGMKVGGQC